MIPKATELSSKDISFIRTAHSIYVPSTRIKYLNKDDCFVWPDLEGIVYPMTPGEIARVELEREFGKPRIWVKKKDLEKLSIPPPQYYDGVVRSGKLWYVDLNSAYHQIYKYLSLDIVWPRGQGGLLLNNVAERLAPNKLARNSLVGISRSRKLWLDTPQGTKEINFHNPFFNPNLWRTIQSILHEIATTAIKGGCCYVSVDGYIFDNLINFTDFTEYLNGHRLSFKTKKGSGYIRGFADYKVGAKETKVKAMEARPLDKIERLEKGCLEWLTKVRESYFP